MEEIKVGEYIRTKEDGICKLIAKEMDADAEFCGYVDRPFWLRENYIVKHSPNIIDLIEHDDYVNGCRVFEVKEKGVAVYLKLENGCNTYEFIAKGEIKSIVTHQQFNSIKYEVI